MEHPFNNKIGWGGFKILRAKRKEIWAVSQILGELILLQQ